MLARHLAALRRSLEAKSNRTVEEQGLLEELKALDENVLLEKAFQPRALRPSGGCACCGK
jgi:hypothetical protein